jgi:DNA repair ATPase RecN
MVNILVNGGKKEQEYSTVNSTLKKIPLVKGFIASDTASKELDKFYEEKSKVNTLYTDTKFKYSGIKLNSTQEKELKNIQDLNKLYNSAYNDIKEINEQIDEVEKSKIRNENKKQKIDKLEKEIEKIAINLEKESKNLKESIPSYK